MTQHSRWIALLPSLCLTGCFEGLFGGPSLAGEWSGDMDCYHADWVGEFEVRLDLDRDGRGEYSGEIIAMGGASYEGENQDAGLTASVSMKRTSDEEGEQSVKTSWSDCEVWIGDESWEQDCRFGKELWWDGEDDLVGSVGQCDPILYR